MVQLVLIRPGSTDYDVQGRIQGNLDIPLDEKGREQAAAAVECLKGRTLAALYSAAGRAAEETAELIGAALKLRPKTLERLENMDLGLWQGMLIDEVKRNLPKVYKQWQEHPENVCPPEGEMLSEVIERVDAALEKLLRKHRFGAVGIVAPEPLASVIRCRVLRDQLGNLWKATQGCGRVEVLEVQPQLPRSREPGFAAPAVANAPAVQAASSAAQASGNGAPEANGAQSLAAKAK
jgi:broad specificity phosphatase PhoE